MVVVEVRQGTLGVDGRGWGPAENTVDRGSQLSKDDEDDEDDEEDEEDEEEERRTRQEEAEEEKEEEATDIKPNNPHLAGGEYIILAQIRSASFTLWLLAVVVLNKTLAEVLSRSLGDWQEAACGNQRGCGHQSPGTVGGWAVERRPQQNMQQNAALQKISWNEKNYKDVWLLDCSWWFQELDVEWIHQILNPHVMMTRIFHVGICRRILMWTPHQGIQQTVAVAGKILIAGGDWNGNVHEVTWWDLK